MATSHVPAPVHPHAIVDCLAFAYLAVSALVNPKLAPSADPTKVEEVKAQLREIIAAHQQTAASS